MGDARGPDAPTPAQGGRGWMQHYTRTTDGSYLERSEVNEDGSSPQAPGRRNEFPCAIATAPPVLGPGVAAAGTGPHRATQCGPPAGRKPGGGCWTWGEPPGLFYFSHATCSKTTTPQKKDYPGGAGDQRSPFTANIKRRVPGGQMSRHRLKRAALDATLHACERPG